MTTAIDLCAEAYRRANLDQNLTTFSTSLEFPYNLAKDIFNNVVRYINRKGYYWYAETITALAYSPGVYTYSFETLGINPTKVLYIRREATDHWGELEQWQEEKFLNRYRSSAIVTARPSAWSKFGDVLSLNCIPDQDYTLKAYHLVNIPLATNPTDTTIIPLAQQDALNAGVYAYLLQAMGRPDTGQAMQIFQAIISDLLADTKQDLGLATQLPANF